MLLYNYYTTPDGSKWLKITRQNGRKQYGKSKRG